MAVVTPSKAQALTYEQYMTEGEISRRYEIVDGVRTFMPSPIRLHQKVAMNLSRLFQDYERATRVGEAFIAPCDVLITREPLRIRQPDVLFISKAQLAKCGLPTDSVPLVAAPELVVEILSPSETLQLREAKIKDYCAIGVKECWVVHLDLQRGEVLCLTPNSVETIAIYNIDQTVQSLVCPDLTPAVADIFTP